MAAVRPENIIIASRYISNADIAALACRVARLPYAAAVPLLLKESGGKNIWGGDAGSVTQHLHGTAVMPQNFTRALIKVIRGDIPNGAGPCQITYAGRLINGKRDGGYYTEMLDAGLLPWDPYDNMMFGFTIMRKNYEKTKDWAAAGSMYNGGLDWQKKPKAVSYGRDYASLIGNFEKMFKVNV